jgi:hypothetical protein
MFLDAEINACVPLEKLRRRRGDGVSAGLFPLFIRAWSVLERR